MTKMEQSVTLTCYQLKREILGEKVSVRHVLLTHCVIGALRVLLKLWKEKMSQCDIRVHSDHHKDTNMSTLGSGEYLHKPV